MPSHSLAYRNSQYIGTSGTGPWGPRARGFGFESLSGHSAWQTGVIDFGEVAASNVTAIAAAPLWFTATATAGANAHTIACNSSDGYLLITAGDADVTGYSLQFNKASKPVMGIVGPNTATNGITNATLAAGRELFFGARVALSCTAAWSGITGGGAFMGMGTIDTAFMDPLTGALDAIGNAWGFHIAPAGTINLVKMVSTVAQTATLVTTATTLAHTSSSFRARDFHDFAIYIRSNAVAGTSNANNLIEGYIDGKLVGTISGGANPAFGTGTTLYSPTFELINGTGGDCTMAVAEVVTGQPRYHALYGQ